MVVCGLKVTVLCGLGGFEGMAVAGLDGRSGDDSTSVEAIAVMACIVWNYYCNSMSSSWVNSIELHHHRQLFNVPT